MTSCIQEIASKIGGGRSFVRLRTIWPIHIAVVSHFMRHYSTYVCVFKNLFLLPTALRVHRKCSSGMHKQRLARLLGSFYFVLRSVQDTMVIQYLVLLYHIYITVVLQKSDHGRSTFPVCQRGGLSGGSTFKYESPPMSCLQ